MLQSRKCYAGWGKAVVQIEWFCGGFLSLDEGIAFPFLGREKNHKGSAKPRLDQSEGLSTVELVKLWIYSLCGT